MLLELGNDHWMWLDCWVEKHEGACEISYLSNACECVGVHVLSCVGGWEHVCVRVLYLVNASY